jgi:uncharacterized protein (TIGR00369 family)
MADHANEIPPAAVLLGREIVSVDAETGEVQLRFLADRQFSNRHGTVQGGMLAAMLDSATGNAVIANLPSDRTAVTTRLDTTFVKPAALGPLTATARLVRLDDRSASAEAELVDSSGQVVARAERSCVSGSAIGASESGIVAPVLLIRMGSIYCLSDVRFQGYSGDSLV